MSSGKLVLITGANGHIGFRTVVEALKQGYSVRAAVRNQEKASSVLAAPSIKALNPGPKLTFTFVPDLLRDGAYDAAANGVDYIIHVASPIASHLTADYERALIAPALKGTLNILYSAFQQPTVRRIVITSSVAAQVSHHDFVEADTGAVCTETSRTPDAFGPFSGEFAAYAASKVRALNATERLLDERRPHFSVVHVHPGFVVGRNELVTDAKDITNGTNGVMFAQVRGLKNPHPTPGTSVHLHDVAFLHVRALDPAIPDRQSLLAVSGGVEGTHWSDVLEIVQRRFPGAVKSATLPNNGESPTKKVHVDATETQRLTGIQFTSFEEQVVSVTEHYLELVG